VLSCDAVRCVVLCTAVCGFMCYRVVLPARSICRYQYEGIAGGPHAPLHKLAEASVLKLVLGSE
jgi:hypothetical protein